MFLDDKAGGEPRFPHCVTCKAPIYRTPVAVETPDFMAGDYHPECHAVIAGTLRAYETLSRWGA